MADDLNSRKRKKQQKSEKASKKQKTGGKKNPGFDEEKFKETEYFIKCGLRHVKPYPFTFTTYCKGRWLRKKLIDVLTEEFQAETRQYYSTAIKNGNIKVNGVQASEEYLLKDNDIISHKVHRHEPPVTSDPIQIIAETDDIVVVNKPSSIPIHPCGRYRHNTLVFLLGREFGFTNLYTIHRIDRLTSGIVIFAKSLKKAQELEKQVRAHQLEKEYVCKVQGDFPSEQIDCNEPIAVVSHKVGVCRVHPDGKPCRTVFIRESFDGTNSIVKCRPLTGRMHQIRVHLQWLGFPIVDDPIYNHEAWGGRGRGGVPEETAWKVIQSIAMSLRDNDNTPEARKLTVGKGDTEYEQSGRLENKTNNTCNDFTAERLTENPSTETTQQEKDLLENSELKTNAELELNSENAEAETASVKEGETSNSIGNCDNLIHCDIKNNETESLLNNRETTNSLENCFDNENSVSMSLVEKAMDTAKGDTTNDHGDCHEMKCEKKELQSNESKEFDKKEGCLSGQEVVSGCAECQRNRPDPTPADLTMCLHAVVYKGPGWEFRCPWPSWAVRNKDSQNTVIDVL